jgi:HEPN domain-containing protein
MVFHAQQAVEKTFKAFLAWHDRPFRKTHNLVELGQQGAVLAPDLENVFRRVAPLTEYAWRFRYPGEASDPSLEEAEEALALAKGLFETLRKRLPPETYP